MGKNDKKCTAFPKLKALVPFALISLHSPALSYSCHLFTRDMSCEVEDEVILVEGEIVEGERQKRQQKHKTLTNIMGEFSYLYIILIQTVFQVSSQLSHEIRENKCQLALIYCLKKSALIWV